jgi:hypothetical protein
MASVPIRVFFAGTDRLNPDGEANDLHVSSKPSISLTLRVWYR